ncbi:DUF1467 family protein [Pelagibacteraceae bacterium]|nr:DUF1467 family protein [Pelagibacteraceae bacterium]
MGTTGSLIVYVCIWWIVFFSVLPIGIKPSDEKYKETLSGNDPGAPKNPKIAKKFIITTVISSIIFLAIYYMVKSNYLNLREYLL